MKYFVCKLIWTCLSPSTGFPFNSIPDTCRSRHGCQCKFVWNLILMKALLSFTESINGSYCYFLASSNGIKNHKQSQTCKYLTSITIPKSVFSIQFGKGCLTLSFEPVANNVIVRVRMYMHTWYINVNSNSRCVPDQSWLWRVCTSTDIDVNNFAHSLIYIIWRRKLSTLGNLITSFTVSPFLSNHETTEDGNRLLAYK
jgi:hypothetical protein